MAQDDARNSVSESVSAPVLFSAMRTHLFVEAPKANDAVLFYKAAFGAEELSRALNTKRKAEYELPLILAAELQIAGSTVVVADVSDDSASLVKGGRNGVVLCLETDDVEAAIAKAVGLGAVAEGDVVDGAGAGVSCGGRVGMVKDPYGFVWIICSLAKKCGADVEA